LDCGDAMNDGEVSSGELSSIVLEQADRIFRGEATKERLAAADNGVWPADMWRAVEDVGLPLAMVAETQGGVGLSANDALRVIRRAGYYTLPVPLPETIIAAALWTRAGGEAPAGSLSLAPTSPGDAVTIESSASDYVLNGSASRVPWGAQAEHVLVEARAKDGGGYLVLLSKGAAKTELKRNLAYEPRDTLIFSGTKVPRASVRPVPSIDDDRSVLLFGALIRSQQMVGAMERCLDYAIAYAMERKQFGRAIAKFQAIQQMLADAAGQYAAAAAGADLASSAYDTKDFALSVAIAKARVGEACGKIAEVAHQVHGAMGFTQEHPLHFATRRLWSWRDEFGNDGYWQERIGRLVCSRGGDALWPMLVG
jgi:acyl-CoA dehydrogenase